MRFQKIKKEDGEIFKLLETRISRDFVFKIDRETGKIVTFYKIPERG